MYSLPQLNPSSTRMWKNSGLGCKKQTHKKQTVYQRIYSMAYLRINVNELWLLLNTRGVTRLTEADKDL